MTHIFLYGPPGSGKSSIGKILARNLKLPFIDLDRVIEANAGIPIPQIMAQQGEFAFRDIETSALKSLLNNEISVVALGGGALLRDDNRAFAESNGQIVVLLAEAPILFQRINGSPNERPLLSGDTYEKLTSLLKKRAQHYSSFAITAHVDESLLKQNVYKVQTALGRHHLAAMGEYDVVVGAIPNLPYPNSIIVTDENIAKLHLAKIELALRASGVESNSIIIPAGEQYKNLQTVSLLWKTFLEKGLDRKSTVIALGGGVIGDLSGFSASTYMRGINWVGIPTTLLSMVDASLGGKTGFDLPEGKNLIGSFYPPKLVLADPSFLLTLPDSELISGMAEVVKHGIISDPELFSLCGRGLGWVKNNLEKVVKRAMAVKIKVIEEDPYEKGIRAALNLGHTVGHAVELVSKFKLRHGEAIAIGMVVEAKYAARVGLAGKGTAEAIEESLSALGLPIRIPKNLPHDEIIRAMRMDKKKSGVSIRFALPVEIGRIELVEVNDLESVLED